jgi:HD superfamily phosphohydrolase
MSQLEKIDTYHFSETLIFDNIHGYIEIDEIAKSIIDTPEFQRMRRIHQDGALHYVFPTANHSRFEHSIGTYHLAKKMISTIKNKQPELKITDRIVKVISLAGLCHDLGHLMYSHLFDDLFLSKLGNKDKFIKNSLNLCVHEDRSILILSNMIKEKDIKIDDDELDVIKDLIHPGKNYLEDYKKWSEEFKVGKWIFQIVSNPKNNIDVDKFDYINRDNKAIGLKLDVDFSRLILQARVINDEIFYPIQSKENLYHLFFVRYQLHRRIYHHKTVKAVEILIVKILFELEKTHQISEYLLNYDKIQLLVDNFIFHTDNKNVKKLINDIETRNLPSLIYEKVSLTDDEVGVNYKDNDKETFYTIKYKVGYSSDSTNPLSKINFYKPKDKMVVEDINVRNFSLLTNDNHQEFVTRIYSSTKI